MRPCQSARVVDGPTHDVVKMGSPSTTTTTCARAPDDRVARDGYARALTRESARADVGTQGVIVGTRLYIARVANDVGSYRRLCCRTRSNLPVPTAMTAMTRPERDR